MGSNADGHRKAGAPAGRKVPTQFVSADRPAAAPSPAAPHGAGEGATPPGPAAPGDPGWTGPDLTTVPESCRRSVKRTLANFASKTSPYKYRISPINRALPPSEDQLTAFLALMRCGMGRLNAAIACGFNYQSLRVALTNDPTLIERVRAAEDAAFDEAWMVLRRLAIDEQNLRALEFLISRMDRKRQFELRRKDMLAGKYPTVSIAGVSLAVNAEAEYDARDGGGNASDCEDD